MGTPVFNWSDYLRLARQLSSQADEASQRTSISRAYYCVYHKASELAIANGYIDEKSHFKLWDVYNRNTDRTCRQLYNVAWRMKKERVDADYDPAATRITERMKIQLSRANSFLGILSSLPSGLPKP
jgi:uncharacterized protein (UPF0332 family)